MASVGFGIDTTRIYFREEIAEMWGYEVEAEVAELDPKQAASNLRRWFKRHFTSKGLKVHSAGGRVAVHGKILSDWVLYNSGPQIE